jgi:hypothetical protein
MVILRQSFGNVVATSQYAKSSSQPFASRGDGNEENNGTNNGVVDENLTTSSCGRSAKKAKSTESDIDSLVSTFEHSSERPVGMTMGQVQSG